MQRDDAVLFEGTCIVTTYENGSVWLVRLGRDSVIALVDANGDATISAWGEDVSEDVARKGRCWINTYLSGAIRNAICIGVHGDIPELANNPIRKEGRCVVEYHGGVYLTAPALWNGGVTAKARLCSRESICTGSLGRSCDGARHRLEARRSRRLSERVMKLEPWEEVGVILKDQWRKNRKGHVVLRDFPPWSKAIIAYLQGDHAALAEYLISRPLSHAQQAELAWALASVRQKRSGDQKAWTR